MREDSKGKDEVNLTADHFIEIWLIEDVMSCESVNAAALDEVRRLVKIADVTFLNEVTELAETAAIGFLNETVQVVESIEISFFTEVTDVADWVQTEELATVEISATAVSLYRVIAGRMSASFRSCSSLSR